ncbi:uncharacterized protein VTP21DRAFT_4112 [Calcarisporiella thermophila]|uniref:uncharacterized protein n=1 Tax=Calcarisporiella thermophila TaxID=911321 RepID=UPI0037445D5E
MREDPDKLPLAVNAKLDKKCSLLSFRFYTLMTTLGLFCVLSLISFRTYLSNVDLGKIVRLDESSKMVHDASETVTARVEINAEVKEDPWTVFNNGCRIVNFEALIENEGLGSTSTPVALLTVGGKVVRKDYTNITLPATVCVIVALPAPPPRRNDTAYSKVHSMPPDSVMVIARGADIVYPLETEPVGNAWIYAASALFLHEDVYGFDIQIEERNYEWNAEPGLTPQPIYQPQPITLSPRVRVKLPQTEEKVLELPQRKPCNALSDMRGRWVKQERLYRDNAEDPWATLSSQPGWNHVVDEFGYVFVPDRCRLHFYSQENAYQCLSNRTLHVYGDSNMRRSLRALRYGNAWCPVGHDICDCDDTLEDNVIPHPNPWIVQPTVPLEIPETGASVYYHFIGGLVRQNLPWGYFLLDSATSSARTLPRADLVVVSTGNWDSAFTEYSVYEQALNRFVHAVGKEYAGTPVILRPPQSFCCFTTPGRHWTRLRMERFRRLIREKMREANITAVWDTGVLGMRPEVVQASVCENFGNHAHASFVRMENQLLLNMICEQPGMNFVYGHRQ